MEVSINWNLVRSMAMAKGLTTYAQLAEAAGVHKNTCGKKGVFTSTTLGKLAKALDCNPCKIIMVSAYPSPAATTGKRNKKKGEASK